MRSTLAFLVIFAFLAAFLSIEAECYVMRGKRAINPFMDSIGKRSEQPLLHFHKRYFDSLAGQSLGKREISVILPLVLDE
uniref:Uncharacterized protein n=1 Tax=Panagrolaimus sp. PS1159 TaxID=55785 RepID=A0AC35GS91_9BILA